MMMCGLTSEDLTDLAEREFILAVEALGVSDAWVTRRIDDRGRGLGVSFIFGGKLMRHVVFMEDFDSQVAFDALLEWTRFVVDDAG